MSNNETQILEHMRKAVNQLESGNKSLSDLHELRKKFYTSFKIARQCQYLQKEVEELRIDFENLYNQNFRVACMA